MEGTTSENSFIESRERYQAFLRNSQEGIWRIELDVPIPIKLPAQKQIELMYKHAWLAEANPAMAKMYGFRTVKPLIGIRLGDMLIESDPNNIEYLKSFIKHSYKLSGTESHEKDRNGNDRYFRNSLTGIVEDGKLIRAWGTQQDITDKHMAVVAQQKSENRLELALKASKVGIWEWDIKSKELTWSNELKKIFGLPVGAEITFEKYLEMLHPEDRDRMQQVIERGMRNGKSYWIEHRVVHPDGNVHWVLGQGKAFKEDGEISYMMGTSMLIDDRKQFEAQIVESEARFRAMADTAPVMIWVSDENMKITYVNRLLLKFSGRKIKEKLNDNWQNDVHPDDLDVVRGTISRALENSRDYSMEFRTRRADGQYRYVLAKAMPRFSREGKFLGYIGSTMDIEDIKNAIRRSTELELTNAQLMKLNEAKDEFISIASHQLRTPATGVKQYIGMVLEGFAGALNKDQQDMLKLAYQSNERQINIINDLLRVAQVDAGKVELQWKKSDIVAIIKNVIQEQASKFQEREQRVAIIAPKDCFIFVDPRLLRMVLENLLDNASKYSPVKSKVRLTVKVQEKVVAISIKDQGVGIDDKDRVKLFQKFQRIQNHLTAGIEGNGLGLYWCKSIIDLHGGRIDVRSKPNYGSTFSIKLPLRDKSISKSPKAS